MNGESELIVYFDMLTASITCNKMSPQPVKSTQMSISERRNKRRKVVYFLSDSFEKMSIETRLPTMPIASSIGVNVFFSMSETSFSDEFIFFFLFCFFRLNFWKCLKCLYFSNFCLFVLFVFTLCYWWLLSLCVNFLIIFRIY